MYLYQHGQQWYVTYNVGSRRYQEAVTTFQGTSRDEAAAKAEAIIKRKEAQMIRSRIQAAQESALGLYQKRLKHRSQSYEDNCFRYQQRLEDFFGEDCDLATLSRRDVERWRDWLTISAPRNDGHEGRLSPKTIREHLCWLSAVYNHAGWRNPCKGVELPKLSQAEEVEALEYFTQEELRKLFDACRRVRPDFLNAFTFLTYTGCRTGEMYGLHNSAEDLERKKHVIWVTGKGSKRRPLNLSGPTAPAWTALMNQIKDYPRDDGFIFPRGHGKKDMWAYDALQRVAGEAFGTRKMVTSRLDGTPNTKLEPLRAAHPHMLRHTLASMALMHFEPHWDITFLAKWLGHTNVSTTFRIYSHWMAPEAPSGYGRGLIYNASTRSKKAA